MAKTDRTFCGLNAAALRTEMRRLIRETRDRYGEGTEHAHVVNSVRQYEINRHPALCYIATSYLYAYPDDADDTDDVIFVWDLSLGPLAGGYMLNWSGFRWRLQECNSLEAFVLRDGELYYDESRKLPSDCLTDAIGPTYCIRWGGAWATLAIALGLVTPERLASEARH